ncbi:integration host factor subunit alpha [Methylocystis sp.]|jgi:integration host factor subunit alpha|uniref:integration host factor subunit alpha n=1 Tax=Methylocystis sp. TaxID=1911079 RepID=UPI003DA37401
MAKGDATAKPNGEAKEKRMARGGTVTRSDLADAVHRKVGVPRAESAKCVEMVLEEIFERIVAREDVKLSSFGAFTVRSKKERLGRNPKTGAGAMISARLVVSFKPSNIMRARINSDE